MGFHDLVSIANRAALKTFGEPESATLLFKATRIPVDGIYSTVLGGVAPLDGHNIQPGIYFHCLATDVIGVGPGWRVDVRSQILPVLAAMPDGAGFVELYLGDPE